MQSGSCVRLGVHSDLCLPTPPCSAPCEAGQDNSPHTGQLRPSSGPAWLSWALLIQSPRRRGDSAPSVAFRRLQLLVVSWLVAGCLSSRGLSWVCDRNSLSFLLEGYQSFTLGSPSSRMILSPDPYLIRSARPCFQSRQEFLGDPIQPTTVTLGASTNFLCIFPHLDLGPTYKACSLENGLRAFTETLIPGICSLVPSCAAWHWAASGAKSQQRKNSFLSWGRESGDKQGHR